MIMAVKARLASNLASVRSLMDEARTARHRRDLAPLAREQEARFQRLARDFENIYRRLPTDGLLDVSTTVWKEYLERLEATLLPSPALRFLRHPVIGGTMVFVPPRTLSEAELTYVRSVFKDNDIRQLLKEDPLGAPPLLTWTDFPVSPNSIHLLYHLAHLSNLASVDVSDLNSVVEWGGGYGRLARLFTRFFKEPPTYTIIDLPFFSTLQWLYLSSILGEASVNLLRTPSDAVEQGKINLIPVSMIPDRLSVPDLFISSWALSESSSQAQDLVIAKDWFGARHLLLGFQEDSEALPDATRVGRLAESAGAKIVPLELQPGNYYAIK